MWGTTLNKTRSISTPQESGVSCAPSGHPLTHTHTHTCTRSAFCLRKSCLHQASLPWHHGGHGLCPSLRGVFLTLLRAVAPAGSLLSLLLFAICLWLQSVVSIVHHPSYLSALGLFLFGAAINITGCYNLCGQVFISLGKHLGGGAIGSAMALLCNKPPSSSPAWGPISTSIIPIITKKLSGQLPAGYLPRDYRALRL